MKAIKDFSSFLCNDLQFYNKFCVCESTIFSTKFPMISIFSVLFDTVPNFTKNNIDINLIRKYQSSFFSQKQR